MIKLECFVIIFKHINPFFNILWNKENFSFTDLNIYGKYLFVKHYIFIAM